MKKNLISFLLIAIIFFGTGFLVGKMTIKTIKRDANDTFSAGWEAAKERLSQNSPIKIDENTPVKTIIGVVEKIYEKKLNIKINPLSPLADPNLDLRIIIIDQKTEIFQIVKKDKDQLKKEADEFSNNNKDYLNSPIGPGGPSFYTEKKVDISGLSEKDSISVEALKDFRNDKEITAKKITILLQ